MTKNVLFVYLIAVLAWPAWAEDANASRPQKLLFLGNSITLHGPNADIGWVGNWGMAASAAEKDYVHLLSSRFAEASGNKPQVIAQNIADFERQYDTYDITSTLKEELAFGADVAIVAIGENVPALTDASAQEKYKTAFTRLLAEISKIGHPRIIVRSCFWPDRTKDEIMRQSAEAAGAIFVDIGPLTKAEANFARSERKIDHAGVAAHPGDQGMQVIADALWHAIEPTIVGKK